MTHHVLFGTGTNTIIHNTQQKIGKAISDEFSGRTTLIRILGRLSETDTLIKSSSLRSRGFFFTLLGSACAYLQGQSTLFVYENGIGAIDLPFRESEVGLDHSRAVHPRSLLYISELVTQLLGKSFLTQNPFLFQTKAQMCQILLQSQVAEFIFDTVSCDRRRREYPMQCGYCSSCLLRRQALAAVEIEDKTDYTVKAANVHGRELSSSKADHLRAMLDQIASRKSRQDNLLGL